MKTIWTPEQIFQHINKNGMIIPDVFISENFSWGEVLAHQTEKPTLNVLKNLFIVTRKLQTLRNTVFKNAGISISCGWRSLKYNDNLRKQGIPTAKKSYHIDGMAIDFNVTGYTPKQVQKLLDNIWNGGLEYAGTWTHIDIRPYSIRFDSKGNVYKVGEFFK